MVGSGANSSDKIIFGVVGSGLRLAEAMVGLGMVASTTVEGVKLAARGFRQCVRVGVVGLGGTGREIMWHCGLRRARRCLTYLFCA